MHTRLRVTSFATTAALVTAATALLLSACSKDAGGPWFGLDLPEQRAVRPEGFELDWGPLTLRLPEAEDPYRDLEAEEMLAVIDDVVAIAEQSRADGVGLWGRIPGSRYAKMTAEYAAERFRTLGLEDVHIDTFEREPTWLLHSWELTLLADPAYGEGTEDIVLADAYPIGGSPSTPEEGLEAELVYVGLGTPADLLGRDLRGKVAVVHSIMQPSPNSHTAENLPPELIKAGAVGCLVVMDLMEPLQFMPVGVSGPGVLGFTLNGIEGSFIEDVIAGAGEGRRPRVRMKVQSSREKGWIARNALGLIPGELDEYVIVIAHTDSFFQGAIDNAAGIANMLALARHYARPGAAKPRRNMLFVATSGHHVGSVGVRDLITRYPEIMGKTVYAINCEHLAALHAYQLHRGKMVFTANVEDPLLVAVSNRSPLLLELLGEAVDRYGLVVNLQTSHYPGGDPYPFWTAGVPVVNLIALPLYYHTTRDLPEVMSGPGLERVARAVAWFMDQTMARSRADLERGSVKTPWSDKRGPG
jgi:hypothetical protein